MNTAFEAVNVLRPGERISTFIYDIIVVIAGSLLVGLSAQIKFYLLFSPVPITAQTFAVLVLGTILGSRRGSLAMLVYLLEGVLGLPVFALGGGLAILFGPTGGFLVGFIAAAYVTGKLAEKGWNRHVFTTILAMIAGEVSLYAFGIAWLVILTNTKTALEAGLYPFIIGDICKIAAAAVILPARWKATDFFKRFN